MINRLPYPILHLIWEESCSHDRIPARNIALLEKLGRDKMQALLQACFDEGAK